MKKIIAASAFTLIVSVSYGQQTRPAPGYVTVQEGKTVLVSEGKTTTITENLMLNDGSMVTPQALFVRPDGTSQKLEESDKVLMTGERISRQK